MEEWSTLERDFPTKEKALKAAGIIQITESRLSSNPNGVQFDIETEIFEMDGRWRIKFRKVFAGYSTGCGSCSSCKESNLVHKKDNQPGKLIEFKRNKQKLT
ncbi:MAG: hypothetical protein ROZ36_19430 [Thermincola sp.]|nr:hypothetical protein [Thermincola sp.]